MLTSTNSDALVASATERRQWLENCLKWQAKCGAGFPLINDVPGGYRPLEEALLTVLTWLGGSRDGRAWQAMVRKTNSLWWGWYDTSLTRIPEPLPFELMSWLRRPDDFEEDLKELRERVLKQSLHVAG